MITQGPRSLRKASHLAAEGNGESIGSDKTAVEPTADSERVMSRLLGLQLAHTILDMEDDTSDELLGNLEVVYMEKEGRATIRQNHNTYCQDC